MSCSSITPRLIHVPYQATLDESRGSSETSPVTMGSAGRVDQLSQESSINGHTSSPQIVEDEAESPAKQRYLGGVLKRRLSVLLQPGTLDESALRALVWLLQPLADHPLAPDVLKEAFGRHAILKKEEHDEALSSLAEGVKSLMAQGNSPLHSLLDLLLANPLRVHCPDAFGSAAWNACPSSVASSPIWELLLNELETEWLKGNDLTAWKTASWILSQQPHSSPGWVLRLAIGYLQGRSSEQEATPVWPTKLPHLEELTPFLQRVSLTSDSPLHDLSRVLVEKAPHLLPSWHHALRHAATHAEAPAETLGRLPQALSDALPQLVQQDAESLTKAQRGLRRLLNPQHLEDMTTTGLLEILQSIGMHAPFAHLSRPVWETLYLREFSREEALQLFSILHMLPNLGTESPILLRLTEVLSSAFEGLCEPLQIWAALRQVHSALHPARSDRGPRTLEHVLQALRVVWSAHAENKSLAKASWQLAVNLVRNQQTPMSPQWMVRLGIEAALLGTEAEWQAACTALGLDEAAHCAPSGGDVQATLTTWGYALLKAHSELLPFWCQELSALDPTSPCLAVRVAVAERFPSAVGGASWPWLAQMLPELPWEDLPMRHLIHTLQALSHVAWEPKWYANKRSRWTPVIEASQPLWLSMAGRMSQVTHDELLAVLRFLPMMQRVEASHADRIAEVWVQACQAGRPSDVAFRLHEVMTRLIERAPHLMGSWARAIRKQAGAGEATSLREGCQKYVGNLLQACWKEFHKPAKSAPTDEQLHGCKELQRIVSLDGMMGQDLLQWRALLFTDTADTCPLEWDLVERLSERRVFSELPDDVRQTLIRRVMLYTHLDDYRRSSLKILMQLVQPPHVHRLPAPQDLQHIEALCISWLLPEHLSLRALFSERGEPPADLGMQALATEWFLMTIDWIPRPLDRGLELLSVAQTHARLPPDKLLSLFGRLIQSATPATHRTEAGESPDLLDLSTDLEGTLAPLYPELDAGIARCNINERLHWIEQGFVLHPSCGWRWLEQLMEVRGYISSPTQKEESELKQRLGSAFKVEQDASGIRRIPIPAAAELLLLSGGIWLPESFEQEGALLDALSSTARGQLSPQAVSTRLETILRKACSSPLETQTSLTERFLSLQDALWRLSTNREPFIRWWTTLRLILVFQEYCGDTQPLVEFVHEISSYEFGYLQDVTPLRPFIQWLRQNPAILQRLQSEGIIPSRFRAQILRNISCVYLGVNEEASSNDSDSGEDVSRLRRPDPLDPLLDVLLELYVKHDGRGTDEAIGNFRATVGRRAILGAPLSKEIAPLFKRGCLHIVEQIYMEWEEAAAAYDCAAERLPPQPASHSDGCGPSDYRVTWVAQIIASHLLKPKASQASRSTQSPSANATSPLCGQGSMRSKSAEALHEGLTFARLQPWLRRLLQLNPSNFWDPVFQDALLTLSHQALEGEDVESSKSLARILKSALSVKRDPTPDHMAQFRQMQMAFARLMVHIQMLDPSFAPEESLRSPLLNTVLLGCQDDDLFRTALELGRNQRLSAAHHLLESEDWIDSFIRALYNKIHCQQPLNDTERASLAAALIIRAEPRGQQGIDIQRWAAISSVVGLLEDQVLQDPQAHVLRLTDLLKQVLTSLSFYGNLVHSLPLSPIEKSERSASALDYFSSIFTGGGGKMLPLVPDFTDNPLPEVFEMGHTLWQKLMRRSDNAALVATLSIRSGRALVLDTSPDA
ncbi:MAG: hypothetical protein ACOYKZ_00035 [Chlamydiia bacterium]